MEGVSYREKVNRLTVNLPKTERDRVVTLRPAKPPRNGPADHGESTMITPPKRRSSELGKGVHFGSAVQSEVIFIEMGSPRSRKAAKMPEHVEVNRKLSRTGTMIRDAPYDDFAPTFKCCA